MLNIVHTYDLNEILIHIPSLKHIILSNIFAMVKKKNHGVSPPLAAILTTTPTHKTPQIIFMHICETMCYTVSIDPRIAVWKHLVIKTSM